MDPSRTESIYLIRTHSATTKKKRKEERKDGQTDRQKEERKNKTCNQAHSNEFSGDISDSTPNKNLKSIYILLLFYFCIDMKTVELHFTHEVSSLHCLCKDVQT